MASAVVATRVHAHGLSRTTTGITGHYCDGCRAILASEAYRCAPCNFDLCGACFGKNKSTQATRVHAHPVTYTTTGLDSHFCDVCASPTPTEAWRCVACNFDICATCFDTIKTPKPTPTPVEAKATPTPTPTPTPAPLAVKQHAHPLTRTTTGLEGHFCDGCKAPVTDSFRCAPCNWDLCATCYTTSTQTRSRLHTHPLTHTTTVLDGHYCDGCRRTITSASYRCGDCNFDLCGTCATRSAAPKPTVEVKATPAPAPAPAKTAEAKATEAKATTEAKVHAHALTRTTTGISSHFCDGCRATDLTVSYRCAPCNHDLCPTCYARTNTAVFSLHPHALTHTTGESLASHFCDGCRGSIAGVSWRCDGCNFDLCPTCVTRVRAPKPAAPRVAIDAKVEPVVTKAHAHALTRTTGAAVASHFCDGCRATSLTVSHRCEACNFDLCDSCFARNRLSHTSRLHAHPLTFARGLSGHSCDDCRRAVTAAWRCADCDFDLCVGCFARAKLPKPVEAKEAKATPTPAPATPTPTPVRVAEVKTTEAKATTTAVEPGTHEVKGHSHRVTAVTTGLTGHFCDSCRASPLTVAYRCGDCNYDLCTGCFTSARVQKTSRVHTHPLRWSTGLSSHYCDVCRKTSADVYRCAACNFDCCAACYATAEATPVAAAAAAAPAFWSCTACTYGNPASSPACYICSTAKPTA